MTPDYEPRRPDDKGAQAKRGLILFSTGILAPPIMWIAVNVAMEVVASRSPQGGGVNIGAALLAMLALAGSVPYAVVGVIIGITLMWSPRQ